MNSAKRPVLVRLYRIVRMALGLVFTRHELWTIVEGKDIAEAVDNAYLVNPLRDKLVGVMVNPLPGFHTLYRVQYIYGMFK